MGEILSIPALGGSERHVAEFTMAISSGFSCQSLAWSPDGRSLVTPANAPTGSAAAVFLVSSETGEKRQITFPPASAFGDCAGAIAPDGRTLAFVRRLAGTTGDLYTVPLARDLTPEGEPRPVNSGSHEIQAIAWTADSREIVFSANYGGSPTLWRVAVSGAAGPLRMTVGQHGGEIAISRQGNRLVYSQSVFDTNIWRVNLSDLREPPVQLIASTLAELSAMYSPDGKKIVFVSDRSGHREIWLCNADGSEPVQMTVMGRAGHPGWSPDSQQIVFGADVEGHAQIFTVSARGGNPRRMTHSQANDDRAAWSHDGKWVYFRSNRTGAVQVWKVAAGGGEPIQITRKGGGEPFESADGKTLYYDECGKGQGLCKVPAEGGEETQVLDRVPQPQRTFVTAGGIYTLWRNELRYLSFATGTTKPVLTIEKPTSTGLSLSPDEHWLLYSQLDHTGINLTLVDNFR